MRTLLRRFDRFRRDNTAVLARWAYRQLGRDKFLLDERLSDDEVRRILVLRNNKRIGNMYFMLPFLHGLRRAYPDAIIDLMVIDEPQARIFKHLDLDNVFVSNFSFDSSWSFLKLINQCRQTVYDLLIMPHSSATDTIIGGLLHARNKIAFWGPETCGVYRHAFDVKPVHPHAALSALTLLRELGHDQSVLPSHEMAFVDAETLQASEVIKGLRGKSRYCITYFRGARGNKVVGDRQWKSIRERFDQVTQNNITWVEILSPDIRQPLSADCRTFESSDFRTLAAVLRESDLFICADTGPLHLADAAGARCVGLFTVTNIEHYGCLGEKTLNLKHIDELDAEAVLTQLVKCPASADNET